MGSSRDTPPQWLLLIGQGDVYAGELTEYVRAPRRQTGD